MLRWSQIFGSGSLKLIGMIHAPALPGTPKSVLSISQIVDRVRREAEIYAIAGVDAVLIENMHDIPYAHSSKMGPEITAAMTRICSAVRELSPKDTPCGVQILAAANREALAVAQASNLQFIRCEGFVFSHVADEGWTDSCAAELLRYRRNIAADDVMILTDIKKKHSSHSVTADIDIGETAAAAEFFLSDGLIVTGTGTGNAAEVEDLIATKKRSSLPVLIGSGVTLANVEKFSAADGLIVGSYFKINGRWDQELEKDKISKLVSKIQDIRGV